MKTIKPSLTLSLMGLCLLVFAGSLSAQSPASDVNRFGVVEGFWLPDLTCDLGVGWERIIFNWEQHQPTGRDDWYTLNVDDRWLKAADACNREIVALLKYTPAWATEGLAGVGVPNGLYLAVDDPDNVWANFVRRAVDYYASRGVHHFIIWNEPDIDADTYGYEFSGDLDDYFQMLKVAYLAAKEANPGAVIHLAGSTYWHDVNAGRTPYMQRLVERILQDPQAAENDYYFDVLSLHIYFRTDTVYDITHEMRTMLDDNGLTDKAIWLNETNAAPTDDPAWPVERPVYDLDLQQQAHYLVQAAALALAADVDRIAAYKLYDQQLPPGGESFGLLNPASAAPRPAFEAWQTVIDHFSDVQTAQLARTPTINAVLMQHTNGRQTLVAWARTDDNTQLEIRSHNDKAYQVDLSGTMRLLRPDSNDANAVYRQMLPAARCDEQDGCFIGGTPFIAIFGPISGADGMTVDGLTVREITSSGAQTLSFE